MASTITIRHDIAITVRDDAVGTKIRRNVSISTLLLLLIFLATTAATQLDGHTPRDGGGHVNDTRGHCNGTANPGNETVYLHDVASKLNCSKKSLPQKLKKLREKYAEIDTSKIDIDLLNNVAAQREKTAESILKFKFNEKRKRWITEIKHAPNWTEGIVYWMYRDQRVQDNWSVLYAQKLAMRIGVPLVVVFCKTNSASNSTLRQYKFMMQGLKEVQSEFRYLNIQFHLLYGSAADMLPNFVRNNKIGGIIVDFLPLRDYLDQTRQLAYIFNREVPIIMVDAHNIVPCWSALNKAANSPPRIENKIKGKLKEFLTEFPPVIRHPIDCIDIVPEPIDWEKMEKDFKIDLSVLPVDNINVGYRFGILELGNFMKYRLKNYSKDSTNPMKNGLSNLSPWLHFGQISAQRVLLEINRFSNKYFVDADSFKEEILIRRELADNFCYYNPQNYDRVEGARYWAKGTLKRHRNDTREYLYTRDQFERHQTHDDLWNAAQIQMIREGKMHRFLRMYWAKKILEWSDTPENALATAIYLNNKYSLDGNDPNSYVGCMWAICGVHDRPWRKGPAVIGQIRHLTRSWCHKKFDTDAFIKKYKRYDYSTE